MTLSISDLQGMTPEISSALRDQGLTNSDKLLAACAQPKDRDELAAKIGVESRTILELANRADLARIRGVGRIYSDLLEFAGVDTVTELRTRNPDNLYKTIIEAAIKHQVKRAPRSQDVQAWVAQAKELDRALHY